MNFAKYDVDSFLGRRKMLPAPLNSHKRVFIAVANFTMGATRLFPEYKVFLIESREETSQHAKLYSEHLCIKSICFINNFKLLGHGEIA